MPFGSLSLADCNRDVPRANPTALCCWSLKLWDPINIATLAFAFTYTDSVTPGEVKADFTKSNINQEQFTFSGKHHF